MLDLLLWFFVGYFLVGGLNKSVAGEHGAERVDGLFQVAAAVVIVLVLST